MHRSRRRSQRQHGSRGMRPCRRRRHTSAQRSPSLATTSDSRPSPHTSLSPGPSPTLYSTDSPVSHLARPNRPCLVSATSPRPDPGPIRFLPFTGSPLPCVSHTGTNPAYKPTRPLQHQPTRPLQQHQPTRPHPSTLLLAARFAPARLGLTPSPFNNTTRRPFTATPTHSPSFDRGGARPLRPAAPLSRIRRRYGSNRRSPDDPYDPSEGEFVEAVIVDDNNNQELNKHTHHHHHSSLHNFGHNGQNSTHPDDGGTLRDAEFSFIDDGPSGSPGNDQQNRDDSQSDDFVSAALADFEQLGDLGFDDVDDDEYARAEAKKASKREKKEKRAAKKAAKKARKLQHGPSDSSDVDRADDRDDERDDTRFRTVPNDSDDLDSSDQDLFGGLLDQDRFDLGDPGPDSTPSRSSKRSKKSSSKRDGAATSAAQQAAEKDRVAKARRQMRSDLDRLNRLHQYVHLSSGAAEIDAFIHLSRQAKDDPDSPEAALATLYQLFLSSIAPKMETKPHYMVGAAKSASQSQQQQPSSELPTVHRIGTVQESDGLAAKEIIVQLDAEIETTTTALKHLLVHRFLHNYSISKNGFRAGTYMDLPYRKPKYRFLDFYTDEDLLYIAEQNYSQPDDDSSLLEGYIAADRSVAGIEAQKGTRPTGTTLPPIDMGTISMADIPALLTNLDWVMETPMDPDEVWRQIDSYGDGSHHHHHRHHHHRRHHHHHHHHQDQLHQAVSKPGLNSTSLIPDADRPKPFSPIELIIQQEQVGRHPELTRILPFTPYKALFHAFLSHYLTSPYYSLDMNEAWMENIGQWRRFLLAHSAQIEFAHQFNQGVFEDWYASAVLPGIVDFFWPPGSGTAAATTASTGPSSLGGGDSPVVLGLGPDPVPNDLPTPGDHLSSTGGQQGGADSSSPAQLRSKLLGNLIDFSSTAATNLDIFPSREEWFRPSPANLEKTAQTMTKLSQNEDNIKKTHHVIQMIAQVLDLDQFRTYFSGFEIPDREQLYETYGIDGKGQVGIKSNQQQQNDFGQFDPDSPNFGKFDSSGQFVPPPPPAPVPSENGTIKDNDTSSSLVSQTRMGRHQGRRRPTILDPFPHATHMDYNHILARYMHEVEYNINILSALQRAVMETELPNVTTVPECNFEHADLAERAARRHREEQLATLIKHQDNLHKINLRLKLQSNIKDEEPVSENQELIDMFLGVEKTMHQRFVDMVSKTPDWRTRAGEGFVQSNPQDGTHWAKLPYRPANWAKLSDPPEPSKPNWDPTAGSSGKAAEVHVPHPSDAKPPKTLRETVHLTHPIREIPPDDDTTGKYTSTGPDKYGQNDLQKLMRAVSAYRSGATIWKPGQVEVDDQSVEAPVMGGRPGGAKGGSAGTKDAGTGQPSTRKRRYPDGSSPEYPIGDTSGPYAPAFSTYRTFHETIADQDRRISALQRIHYNTTLGLSTNSERLDVIETTFSRSSRGPQTLSSDNVANNTSPNQTASPTQQYHQPPNPFIAPHHPAGPFVGNHSPAPVNNLPDAFLTPAERKKRKAAQKERNSTWNNGFTKRGATIYGNGSNPNGILGAGSPSTPTFSAVRTPTNPLQPDADSRNGSPGVPPQPQSHLTPITSFDPQRDTLPAFSPDEVQSLDPSFPHQLVFRERGLTDAIGALNQAFSLALYHRVEFFKRFVIAAQPLWHLATDDNYHQVRRQLADIVHKTFPEDSSPVVDAPLASAVPVNPGDINKALDAAGKGEDGAAEKIKEISLREVLNFDRFPKMTIETAFPDPPPIHLAKIGLRRVNMTKFLLGDGQVYKMEGGYGGYSSTRDTAAAADGDDAAATAASPPADGDTQNDSNKGKTDEPTDSPTAADAPAAVSAQPPSATSPLTTTPTHLSLRYHTQLQRRFLELRNLTPLPQLVYNHQIAALLDRTAKRERQILTKQGKMDHLGRLNLSRLDSSAWSFQAALSPTRGLVSPWINLEDQISGPRSTRDTKVGRSVFDAIPSLSLSRPQSNLSVPLRPSVNVPLPPTPAESMSNPHPYTLFGALTTRQREVYEQWAQSFSWNKSDIPPHYFQHRREVERATETLAIKAGRKIDRVLDEIGRATADVEEITKQLAELSPAPASQPSPGLSGAPTLTTTDPDREERERLEADRAAQLAWAEHLEESVGSLSQAQQRLLAAQRLSETPARLAQLQADLNEVLYRSVLPSGPLLDQLDDMMGHRRRQRAIDAATRLANLEAELPPVEVEMTPEEKEAKRKADRQRMLDKYLNKGNNNDDNDSNSIGGKPIVKPRKAHEPKPKQYMVNHLGEILPFFGLEKILVPIPPRELVIKPKAAHEWSKWEEAAEQAEPSVFDVWKEKVGAFATSVVSKGLIKAFFALDFLSSVSRSRPQFMDPAVLARGFSLPSVQDIVGGVPPAGQSPVPSAAKPGQQPSSPITNDLVNTDYLTALQAHIAQWERPPFERPAPRPQPLPPPPPPSASADPSSAGDPFAMGGGDNPFAMGGGDNPFAMGPGGDNNAFAMGGGGSTADEAPIAMGDGPIAL